MGEARSTRRALNMPKDTTKPSSRARTEDLRKEIEQVSSAWQRPLRTRAFGWAVVIWAVFVLVVGAAAIWTSERPLVAIDRVMRETRTTRVDFTVDDQVATEKAQNAARARAARVYVADSALLEEIRTSLDGLPLAAQGADAPDKIEPGLRQLFGINAAVLDALRSQTTAGKPSAKWQSMVERLNDALARHPILARESFQVDSTAPNQQIELRLDGAGGRVILVLPTNAINAESPQLADELRRLARDAGFEGVLLDVVVNRLTAQPTPTFTFDAAATVERQDRAAAAVATVRVKYPAREIIFRRGDVLSESQLKVYAESMRRELEALTPLQLWSGRAALVGLIGGIAIATAGYAILFVPRIRRNPSRMAAVAGLLCALALVALYSTFARPDMIALTATAPTVFCAVMLCIAYNQRTAVAFGALHGLLVCSALDLPVGMYAAIVAGVGAAVWMLKEIRDRDALIRMGGAAALALFVGTSVASLVELPLTRPAIVQSAWDGALAGFGGLMVAAITLFILPSLEKTFGIMTGMTLIELRDPKQPLLRQLQQRAPGTYNHSLTLAALGEAAAEAIGADGLLTYVGALYHDIGKMNKPDYFVENQTPGFNRHDKLTPAMSLLIIVGHVKDGLELAREFNLPRPLWHFIESHHGTTLVEYFYHRAKRQAEAGGSAGVSGAAQGVDAPPSPSQLEYRYPGPRPRTKEAAIIMLCDAVESASRTMADPTPGRIDALVRAIATKRLMDGQFDECDLTLRQLNDIVEAVSKTLASIYHGRIAYPGGGDRIPQSSDTRILEPDRPRTAAGTQIITPGKAGANGPGSGIAALTNPVKVGGGGA